MTCDELRDDYGTYALGALDGDSLAELREHLARQCENCTPGVRQAEGVVARMAVTAAPVEPSKRLRKRVIAMVNPQAGGSLWTKALVLVTALSVFFAVHIWMNHDKMHHEFFDVWMPKYDHLQAENTRLNETLALLEDPAAKEVTFGKGARGRVVISPKHGVAFSGQNMAALAPGKTYEMWIIPKGGKPVPAGTFEPAADGSALHVQAGAVDIASTAAVAVSIEQQGGVASPTADQIIIVAPVGQ
jgi:anti-sigma-K factor RskA